VWGHVRYLTVLSVTFRCSAMPPVSVPANVTLLTLMRFEQNNTCITFTCAFSQWLYFILYHCILKSGLSLISLKHNELENEWFFIRRTATVQTCIKVGYTKDIALGWYYITTTFFIHFGSNCGALNLWGPFGPICETKMYSQLIRNFYANHSSLV